MKYTASEVAEARTRLLDVLKPGDTVYCILRHVSRSGMSRVISLYAKTPDGMQWLDPFALKLGVGSGMDNKREGLKVGGCGMDMGFALVYELAHALFKDGFGCTGENCPSNDHGNGDRDYTPHGTTSHRCDFCQDVPGKDGIGRPCKGCVGGMVETSHVEHWHNDGGYTLVRRWL